MIHSVGASNQDLACSLFGALAGADGWEALEDYAEVQEEFLRCGIPVALSNF